jgi:hypothetical protein
MKKIFLITAAILLASFIQAQTSPIDDLFEKYSDRDGFTTVYISSKMFSIFAGREAKDDEIRNIISKLRSIRILTVEDSTLNKNLNFFKELGKKLDFSVYEELMAVKEGSDVTKFLIRQHGDIISELLVITGGPGDNTLISIKGDLDMKTISEISRSSGLEGLEKLEKIDNKPAPEY